MSTLDKQSVRELFDRVLSQTGRDESSVTQGEDSGKGRTEITQPANNTRTVETTLIADRQVSDRKKKLVAVGKLQSLMHITCYKD